MVSIAFLQFFNFGAIPIKRRKWGSKRKNIARNFALKVLEGVGENDSDVIEESNICYIIRRVCNTEERKLIFEPYLKI